jgi:arginase
MDRVICSPFFMSAPVPGLADIGGPDAVTNDVVPHGVGLTARMASLYGPLAEKVAGAVRAGERPVSLAGDCVSSLGVLAGLQRAGVAPQLLWLDAHGDFNTWATTPSGFLGGMPLAMMVGRGEQTLVDALGLRTIAEDRIVLADGRDLDPPERELLAQSAVRLLDVDALSRFAPDCPLYVHFDCDIVRPEDSPAQSYLAAGGPSAAELEAIFRRLAATGAIAAVSLSAWNPRLPGADVSRRVTMRLVDALLGR